LDVQKRSDVAANRFLGIRLTTGGKLDPRSRIQEKSGAHSRATRIRVVGPRDIPVTSPLHTRSLHQENARDIRLVGSHLNASLFLSLSFSLPSFLQNPTTNSHRGIATRCTLGDPWQHAATRFRLAQKQN